MALIPGRAHGEYVLFCRERDPERELWDGLRAGQDGAIGQYGADDAFPIGDIDDILPGLIEGRDRVYYALGANPDFDRRLMDWINVIRSKARQGAQPPNEFVALDHLLHDQRLYKSANEVKVMRYAAEVSARAHIRAMEVPAGAVRVPPGSRAGIRVPQGRGEDAGLRLDRRRRTQRLHPALPRERCGDQGRRPDPDRCRLRDRLLRQRHHPYLPANGRFSPEQKAIYELVLEANMAAFDYIAPGRHWNEAHEATVRVITAGLVRLGLLEGDVDELIAHEAYKAFYMHRAGHWLGMDVHDVGEYRVGGEWRVLEPGMAMTVEPGIYIAPDNTSVAKKWRGIGVRIEDDVVVTRNGCEVLTNGVPKTVAEIEALMAAAKSEAA